MRAPSPDVGIRACSDCPWRKSNQGRRHPDGWFSQKNLQRLWAGLRSGAAPGMTCHPTHPKVEAPDGSVNFLEHGEKTQECYGALLLVQRELRLIEKLDPKHKPHTFKAYRRLRPRGLTTRGFMLWLERVVFAGRLGTPAMPEVEEDPDVAYTKALP